MVKLSRSLLTLLVCELWLLTCQTSTGAASFSYYSVRIVSSVSDEPIAGYAKIDWSDRSNLLGEICVEGTSRQVIRGRNLREGEAELEISGLTRFGLSTGQVTFKKLGDFSPVTWEHAVNDSNRRSSPRPQLRSMTLIRLAAHPPATSEGQPRSSFARMSMEQAFKEELRRPTRDGGDGGIDPGQIAVTILPDRVAALEQFLPSIRAKIRSGVRDNCDAPYLEEIIHVVPMMENWSAAKLEASGTVVQARLILPGAGPGTIAFATSSPRFLQTVAQNNWTIQERDTRISGYLQELLRAFATERRADFGMRGQITRIADGTPFFYRFQITGLALAVCDRSRWEKIVVQLFLHRSITNESRLGVVLQIQEGFFAPGTADFRPDDSRLSEHRVTDGDLENMQRVLASYLMEQHFEDFSPGVDRVRNIRCGI